MVSKRRELFEIAFDVLAELRGENELTITEIGRRCRINNLQCKKTIVALLWENWIEKKPHESSDARKKHTYGITSEGLEKLQFWEKEIQSFRKLIQKSDNQSFFGFEL